MVETVRYLARCAACGHRAAADATVRTEYIARHPYTRHMLPVIAEDRARLDPWTGEPIPEPQAPGERELWACIQVTAQGGRPFLNSAQRKVFKRFGLWCPNCDLPLQPRPLKATPKPAKQCDDRCVAAISSTCDCSCGGARHGSAWIQEIRA